MSESPDSESAVVAEALRRHHDGTGCRRPPEGWFCSRAADHEGPCAARPLPLHAPGLHTPTEFRSRELVSDVRAWATANELCANHAHAARMHAVADHIERVTNLAVRLEQENARLRHELRDAETTVQNEHKLYADAWQQREALAERVAELEAELGKRAGDAKP